MNNTTTRSRTAHGLAVAVAWTTLAAVLTLVPAGAADAMPRLGRGAPHAATELTTAHVRPMPRLRLSPNPRLLKTPNPRLWSTPNLRLR